MNEENGLTTTVSATAGARFVTGEPSPQKGMSSAAATFARTIATPATATAVSVLFNAMLKDDGPLPSIIVCSLTFGIGHIVNLFSGQASFDTFVQIIFAISWGVMFTMVYYKGKSILPCIIAHSLIDVLSLFGADNRATDMIFVYATIIISILYCIYLSRIKDKQE